MPSYILAEGSRVLPDVKNTQILGNTVSLYGTPDVGIGYSLH